MVQATPSLSPNLDLEHALRLVKAAGYRVSKPRSRATRTNEAGTTNPFGHPFPHAKLRNVSLTSITRLRAPYGRGMKLIENNDPRNYSISGKVEIKEAA
jgi:hypothetical protein